MGSAYTTEDSHVCWNSYAPEYFIYSEITEPTIYWYFFTLEAKKVPDHRGH